MPLRGACLVEEAGPAPQGHCQQHFKALGKLRYSKVLSCFSVKPRPPSTQVGPKQGETLLGGEVKTPPPPARLAAPGPWWR